jgi:spoIIIJ-associated protein
VTQPDNAVAAPSGETAAQDAEGQETGQPSAASGAGPEAAGPGSDLETDPVDGADIEDADDTDADDTDTDADDTDADDAAESEGAPAAASRDRDDDADPEVVDLEQEGEIAADYVEGLLDVADLDGDIDMDVEGDRALVSVVGATLDELVGSRGEVLEALQELTRLAVHRQTGVRTRVMLDVGGYRVRRRAELAETGREAAEEVKRTGEPKRLWAMNRFERKVVHDAIAAAGLASESEGEEPHRKVVVLPAE